VLRSDSYDLTDDHVLRLAGDAVPFVDLDPKHYKLVGDFDDRFADGVPSLRSAKQLVVHGDWWFGRDVTVVGEAVLDDPGTTSRVEPGATLG